MASAHAAGTGLGARRACSISVAHHCRLAGAATAAAAAGVQCSAGMRRQGLTWGRLSCRRRRASERGSPASRGELRRACRPASSYSSSGGQPQLLDAAEPEPGSLLPVRAQRRLSMQVLWQRTAATLGRESDLLPAQQISSRSNELASPGTGASQPPCSNLVRQYTLQAQGRA